MEVIIDTVKVRESGNDLLMLSNDLNNAVKELFERLTLVPSRTKEWVGASADEYVRKLSADRVEYNTLIEEVRRLGNFLVDVSNAYDTAIVKNEHVG